MLGRFAEIGTRVLSAAPPAELKRIHDKADFYAETVLPDAPVAEFRVFENIAQFDAAWAELRPRHAKLCVKPSHSIYGLGFAIVDEARSSAALLLAGAEYHVGYDDLRRGLAEMGEFRYASDLVAFIRAETGDHFHIEVGAYPEMHPQSRSPQADLQAMDRAHRIGLRLLP